MSVRVSGLRCSYHGSERPAVAIDELDLTTGPVGLVGVNGAGKSTLMRTLAGARRPQEGNVAVDDEALYGRRRRRVVQRIGFMPQEVQFPGELSVAQVLDYVGWLRGMSSARSSARRKQVLGAVDLQDHGDSRVKSLSGGMRRRLALASAMLSEPDVLLLDEPTTGLDPAQRAGVRSIISDLGAHTLTIMSSHVMEDVASVTTRVVVLHEGRVLHHGPTEAFVDERGGPDRSPERAFLSMISGA